MANENGQEQRHTHQFEPQDINLRIVVIVALTLIVSAIVIHVVLWFYEKHLIEKHGLKRESAEAYTEFVERLPSPRLQVSPQNERLIWERRQRHLLHTYGIGQEGVKDGPERGFYRIPIEKAMDLYLKRMEEETRGKGK